MGGNKLKLSYMIPNAWFYKLNDMGKRRKNQNPNHSKPKKQPSRLTSSNSSPLITSNSMVSSSSDTSFKKKNSSSLSPSTRRKSQYFKRDLPTLPNSSDTHFLDSPRISSKHRPSTRKNRASSSRRRNNPSASASASAAVVDPKPPTPDSDVFNNADDQLLIRKDSNFCKVLNLQLPSIVTKKEPKMKGTLEKESVLGDRTGKVRRRMLAVTSPGIKLRSNSPKIMTRKLKTYSLKIMNRKLKTNSPKIMNRKEVQGNDWKKLETGAVILISPANTRSDFMDSMVEMIVENDIKRTNDLEDLLALNFGLNLLISGWRR
ncbi:transcription repressor OFP2-like [Impatiens glandulifera]|uniref:transcription repressor OFP2-like n=1 Tax=Impatiens glandulifera TaxID=253017 RepID=UPI001FB08F0B|nr:transcription repressor OFP2-like [Impatiens glandulifera]